MVTTTRGRKETKLSEKHFPIVICGGGLAGISAGYHAPGRHVVLEKSAQPGGLATSITRDGFTFDHTGHLLHLRDTYAMKLIFDLLKDNIQKHFRRAWIYSKRTHTKYPFQANTYGLPQPVIDDCLRGFAEVSRRPQRRIFQPQMSFHDWVLETFGAGFAKHFFFPYNKKLWTVDPTEMTCEWVGQFVPRPTLDEVIDGSLDQSAKEFGYNSEFYYPKTGGIQSLVTAFMHTNRINMKLNSAIEKINLKKRTVHVVGDSEPYHFEFLVNTLPLPHFVQLIEDLPAHQLKLASKLKWTSVLNINFGIKGNATVGGDKHWIYFPENKFPFYRAGFPQNFANTVVPEGCSSIYTEIAYKPHELPQKGSQAEADIIFKCIDGLRDAKILSASDEIATILPIRIPVAYVIYDEHRTSIVNWLTTYLNNHNTHLIGRYGQWTYSFMEKAIMEGKAIADHVSSFAPTSVSH